MMKFKQTLISLGIAAGLSMVIGNAEAGVLVHLFQWKFNDIANECEKVLGPKGYEGVQITPPAEHLNKPDVWWSVYQPVNLRNFHSYGGTEEQLRGMITRCKSAGVKIYVDTVVNNWASYGGSGVGTGGSGWSSRNYPVFKDNDFHSGCRVNNYSDRGNVQNCGLEGMPDLNTGSDYVQNEVATYMKTLQGWGVAGFRLDAAKHIAVSELHAILNKAGNPFAYVEVIGAQGEAVQPGEYMGMNRVTEFGYTRTITGNFNGQIKNLRSLGDGLMSSDKAQVFVSNHDTERNSAGTQSLNYKSGAKYDLAQAFMLAWPYGWTQVYSGYQFNGHDDGAPQSQACSSGWNCEHRRPTVANMVLFRNITEGQQVTNWWDNGNNQIAFGRGNKGFVVVNNEGGSINQSFQTGLPAGEYCNLLAGDAYCSGSYVTVDGSGKASFNVGGMQAAAIIEKCTKTDQSNCKGELPPSKTMFLRSTNNSWAATAMNYNETTDSWSLMVQFTGEGDAKGGQRFKFDVAGDWKEYYGDDNADGIADKSALKDIAFDSKGKYLVTLFNGDKHYTITPYVTPPMECKFKSLNYRGTTNGWKTTPMTLDNATCTWSTVVDFTGQGDAGGAQRFKFDVYGNWQENYGDNGADGVADKNSLKDIAFSGVGQFMVSLTEDGLNYSIKKVETPLPPKAVITPETITVKVGDPVVLDASGSSDDQGIVDYRWSTGGTGKTESVTFNDVGIQKVTVTVTDADGLSASASATVKVEQKPIPDPLHNVAELYYRGTSNSWAPQQLELVADNTWQATIHLTGQKNERFKIDALVNPDDEQRAAYGDRNDDGSLESNTSIFPGYKGTFTLTVNDQDMSYTLEKQGDAYAKKLKTLYLAMPSASGKGWEYQPMKLVSNNLWYVRVKLDGKANQRFRFDIGGLGVKSQIFGDSDKNGVVDAGGTPIAKSGKGYVIIKLNDKIMKYSVVAQ